jgi:hypothetical protein
MIARNEGESPPPLPCGDDVPERSYVIPKFGFVTSTKPPKPPTRRPIRPFTTRPYFLHAAGVERGEIHIAGERCPLATIRKAVPGRMAVLSEGRRARQFYICNGCGARFVEPQLPHFTAHICGRVRTRGWCNGDHYSQTPDRAVCDDGMRV